MENRTPARNTLKRDGVIVRFADFPETVCNPFQPSSTIFPMFTRLLRCPKIIPFEAISSRYWASELSTILKRWEMGFLGKDGFLGKCGTALLAYPTRCLEESRS